MSGKPRIPPEQNQAIVDRYKAGESALLIANSYGVSRSAIHLVLFKMGVPLTHKGGCAPTPPEIREKILKMYADDKIGATTIARTFGVTKGTVYNIITAAGQGTRPRSNRRGDVYQVSEARQRRIDRVRLPPSRHGQLPVNHAAFDVLTPAAAYWLGYLITDGCVYQGMHGAPRVILTQSRDHRGQVERFRAYIGSEHAIQDGTRVTFGKVRYYSTLMFTSQGIADALAGYGIGPRKTGAVEAVPALADNPDFWRGVVDGDGSMYETSLRMNSSSLRLVDQFDQFVLRCVPSANPSRYFNKDNEVWTSSVGELQPAADLARVMYAGATDQTALPDKWERAKVLMGRRAAHG